MTIAFPSVASLFDKRGRTPVPSGRSRNRDVPAAMSLAGVVVLGLVLVPFALNDYRYAFSLCIAFPIALLSLRIIKLKCAAAPAGRPLAAAHKTFDSQKSVLIDVGNTMLAQTRRDHEPLSIILFDQSDLPELLSVFGAGAAQQMVAKMAGTLHHLAGPRGLALSTGATEFTVLMPGLGLDRALAGVRQALGNTYSIEGGARGDEILLVPDFLAQTVRRDRESIEDVYRSMRATIRQAQNNTKLRQDYMLRERESHSTRPSLLAAHHTSPGAP